MQHLDDHDPLGNEPLNKRAIGAGKPRSRHMKKVKKKAKAKPAVNTPTMQKVEDKEPKAKGKGLPPWLVKVQKKRNRKAGKVG